MKKTCCSLLSNTAALTATGLLGGWLTARTTGYRPLGGAVLAACGIAATKVWYKKTDPITTTALLGTYIGAFALSHPLAKQIGSWPAVLAMTTLSSGAACMLSDLKDD